MSEVLQFKPGEVEKHRRHKTEKNVEGNKEKEFERAKQDLLDFLDTPHNDFRAQNKYRTNEVNALFVFEALKEKMRVVVEAAQDKKLAIDFLKSLIINDDVRDGAKIPNIFNQHAATREKKEDFHDYPNAYGFADVFSGLGYNGAYNDDDIIGTTYRSFLYTSAIGAIGNSQSVASECAILDCLSEMDCIVAAPIINGENDTLEFEMKKIGKDLSLQEYKRLTIEGDKKYDRDRKAAVEAVPNVSIDEELRRRDLSEAERVESHLSHQESGTLSEYLGDYAGEIEDYGQDHRDSSEFGFPRYEAIQCLSKMDISEEILDYLVSRLSEKDFLDRRFKDKKMLFERNFDAIVEILNKKPALAAEKLMQVMAVEKSATSKLLATKALYRIELGKINMSEAGVDYLGKRFDLGEYNQPNYVAHRLTGDGKVGVFNERQQAVGYFALHGLGSPEKNLKADVLRFNYETLFYPKPNETPEERQEREQVLEEFKEKYFETYLTDFYKETGVMFNNLNLHEQGWFLWYVQRAGDDEKKQAMNFIKKYKEPGFKTFLSLEADTENGKRILSIGENADERIAVQIFEKFGELANVVEKAGEYLNARFGGKNNFNEQARVEFANKLLQRGRDVIKYFADEIARNKEVRQPELAAELTEKLNNIKSDVVIFASAFKAISAREAVDFNDIKDIEWGSKDSSELTDDEKLEMNKIFINNRSGYTKELLDETKREFIEATNASGKKFCILKDGDEIVAFVRFDRLDNGNLYAGSLNVRPEARGSAIGSAVLKQAFEKEAAHHTVEAVVYEKNPMLKHYIEDFGFKIVGEIPNYHNTGQKFYSIERWPSKDLKRPQVRPTEERLAA